MKKLLLTIAMLTISITAHAEVSINNAWSRATPTAMLAGAAYFQITSDEEDAIVGASTPVSRRAELHATKINANGVMVMEEQKEVRIPKGVEVMFAPGGYHIMLIGLKEPLRAGYEFPLTLYFKNSPNRNIRVTVKPISHKPTAEGESSHHMAH